MQLRELTKEQFSLFVKNYPSSTIYQTTEYAEAMSKQNFSYVYYGM